jgi:hypothetical protein
MIRRKRLTFLICVLAAALHVSFRVYMSALLQLSVLAITFLWLVVLVDSIVFTALAWRELKAKALLPLGACLLTIPAVAVGIRAAETVQFQLQRPSFEKMIVAIESGPKIGAGESRRINPTDVALFVLAERTEARHLQVEFMTWRAFPVKHAGYVYAQQGAVEPGSALAERWPYRRRVNAQWFRVSD